MKPTFVCNSEHFVKTNFPKFYEICERACIDLKKNQSCIVIPTDAKIKDYNKEMKESFGDLTKFLGGKEDDLNARRKKVIDLKSTIYAHFVKEVITPEYKGGVVNNGANEQLKLSGVDKGKITIESGDKFGTKATGKLLDVMGTPNIKEGYRNVSFIQITSGHIDIGGSKATQSKPKLASKLDGGGPEVLGSNSKCYLIKQSANQMILDSCDGTKQNFYIPVVAGLMKCLEAMGEEECKKYAHFFYPCAASTFYVLVQPHNQAGQFLTDSIIEDWMCAPYFCDDYAKQRQEFLDRYAGKSGDRERIAESIKSYPKTQGVSDGFKNLYTKTYNSIFPSGFSPEQKLWADELAYRLYSAMKDTASLCHDADEMAKMSDGSNVSDQTVSGNGAIWETMLAKKEDEKMQEFFRSDWFLHLNSMALHYSDGPKMPKYYANLIKLNR